MGWTIRSLLRWAYDYLTSRQCESPRLDAELLLAHALKLRRLDLYLDMDRPLDDEELARYKALIVRRCKHEPVAYLLGCREFYGYDFLVDSRVLIPRPETEILVEQGVARAPQNSRVLEIGCGSGAVIISLLLEREDLKAVALDISAGALAVTRENAQRHGVAGRLDLVRGDGLDAVRGPFDLIVMNPPYIPETDRESLAADVVDYEPHTALFGGEAGLDVLERVLMEAKSSISPKGTIIMEIGAGQDPAVERIAAAAGLELVSWQKDLAGIRRACVLECPHG